MWYLWSSWVLGDSNHGTIRVGVDFEFFYNITNENFCFVQIRLSTRERVVYQKDNVAFRLNTPLK